jgi:hypothetical protein
MSARRVSEQAVFLQVLLRNARMDGEVKASVTNHSAGQRECIGALCR